jgi:NAD(P)-dependent dehydrogenase (short-subunit alcohol dehydrogenase family)
MPGHRLGASDHHRRTYRDVHTDHDDEESAMTWDPAGKVAVVTGASSGIGQATARRLARIGMTVVAAARREDRLQALASTHPSIVPHVTDVTSIEDVDALAARVREEFGVCHALINSAGISGGSFRGRDDLEEALYTLDVNLNGTIRCMASFADLLEASAPSRVINVASVAGKLAVGPAAYAASKFATVGFTEATSLSWARRRITVCQLNPGFIETEGFPQAHWKRTPLGPVIGKPEDVARAIHRTLLDGAPERTVPSVYRALVVLRHVAAPLWRFGAARSRRASGSRR